MITSWAAGNYSSICRLLGAVAHSHVCKAQPRQIVLPPSKFDPTIIVNFKLPGRCCLLQLGLDDYHPHPPAFAATSAQ